MQVHAERIRPLLLWLKVAIYMHKIYKKNLYTLQLYRTRSGVVTELAANWVCGGVETRATVNGCS